MKLPSQLSTSRFRNAKKSTKMKCVESRRKLIGKLSSSNKKLRNSKPSFAAQKMKRRRVTIELRSSVNTRRCIERESKT
jgi:hypothetical protein